jgi:hypothetical protein
VIAVPAVAIALVVLHPSHRHRAPVRPAPTATATAVASATPTPTVANVTASGMEQMLRRYVNAYSAEDLDALGRLFAPTLERVNGTDPPQGRAGALATYAKQFSQLADPQYSISGITYQEGLTAGIARGRYTITAPSGTYTGFIRFEFVPADGALLIDQITIQPLS